MAAGLSQGQLQLLALTQALLNDKAEILLLDEPTAQVDHESQKTVLKNLFGMAKDMSVLMIAHRLETAVSYADKILVMD